MATQIKETPILRGEDAERFIYNMNNPRVMCKEDIERVVKNYNKIKALMI